MNIVEIAKKIEKSGGTLYKVGGSVRDEILGIKNHDEDYCITNMSTEKFEKLFNTAVKRGKNFPVYDIEGKEFAMARKESKIGKGHKEFKIETGVTIQEDLKRRDITINSIAIEVLTNKIIDPFNGIKDIQERKIRKTSEKFSEDPLRVYRVARFASSLEFEVTKDTIEAMKKCKDELSTISVERVFEEFRKALNSKRPSIFFKVLREADILDIHFKEISDLIGSTQLVEYHPEGDSFEHTMLVVDNCSNLTDREEVRFSALVHDLGKGITPKEMLPHHYGHDLAGAKLVENMGKRLKIPNNWIKCGKLSAKEHMRAGIFEKLKASKKVDLITLASKSILRLEGLAIIVKSDKLGRGNVNFDKIGNRCLKEIDGEYIIKKYGKQTGIKMGELLRKERISWMKKVDEMNR